MTLKDRSRFSTINLMFIESDIRIVILGKKHARGLIKEKQLLFSMNCDIKCE